MYRSSNNKYQNQRICIEGRWFDSKREGRRFQELRLLERGGEISDLKTQVDYELIPTQTRQHGKAERAVHYIADFVYQDNRHGGALVVEDAKGVRTPEYIIKRKLMLQKYGIEVKEV